MGSLLLNSILLLGSVGLVAASVLFFVAKKFYVYENPKIDEVDDVLPSANCGGCGFPGCRAFAEATVGATDLEELFCPVGGNETMKAVAKILGLEVVEKGPMVAVLRCNGSNENSPKKINYDGVSSCLSAHSMYAGEGGCPFGCLKLDDCVRVCDFDALKMDAKTGLPVVDEKKCTACGACVDICPRNIYELRPIGKQSKRVYVACLNTEKGAIAKKNCAVACIGCNKCVKVYDSGGAVVMKGLLSYISPQVDVENQGGYLVGSCPTNAIMGINVEAKKLPPKKKPSKPKEKES
ncbi:MAG: RnfABCDGE type electron transport complex subunit B [Bacteriovoracaceae bacterium]|nr:RnfABCDGE type electron transport complex subunit B [Bacteriovoracaceae bacterium]